MLRTVHKVFASSQASSPRARNSPEWVFSDEWSAGSAVVSLTSPGSSVLGGSKPGCFIAVGLSDGSLQLLLRDGLAQITGAELPRGGNLAWVKAASGSSSGRVMVTICSLAFTATGNCLMATDS